MRDRIPLNPDDAGTCGSFYSTLYPTWESVDYCTLADDEPHDEHVGSSLTWY